jgi:carboxypeptidase T
MLGPLAAVTWLVGQPPAPIALPPESNAESQASAVRVAVRVHGRNPADLAFAESLAIDVWSENRGPDLPLDLVVHGRDLPRLVAAGLDPEVLVPDIDAVARREAARLAQAEVQRPSDWFAEFHDLTAIGNHLGELAEQYPDRVSRSVIGGSIEGRPLWAVRIGGTAPDRTPMLINGAQHAREWIAAMVTTCVADRLVREYDHNPAIREFVDHTELWVVPVVNPDGYQYSWSSDRYWRKNRRAGHGVDLNRNFSVAWGGAGSSNAKRSEIYRGEYAFSEPESIALRDLVRRESIALHVDFHAYGQLVLYPWNYTAAPAKDRDRFAALGDRIASAIFAEHGTRYTLKAGAQLYAAAGTLSDWMYGEAGATSFTVELRPKGGSGFVLPPEQIRPTCDEGLAAVLALRGAEPKR